MRSIWFTLLFMSVLSANSQHQGSNWFFGQQAGLTFLNGPPSAILDGQTYLLDNLVHAEGSSSLSDASGQLLCYCNGEKVWNGQHQLMPNGSGLLGNPSSVQACLIIPKPGSDHLLYVFTTDDWFNNELAGGLRYSVVDLCEEEGLGDIKAEKNVLLLEMAAEKLTSVKHGNGIDYWIITHKYYSDAFHTYLLTEDGISSEVVSSVGAYHPQGQEMYYTSGAMGHLKASPNGEKLAIAGCNSTLSILEYFSFDKWTGIVSEPLDLNWLPNVGAYGLSFSPDNSKLYVTSNMAGQPIHQFDLTAGGGTQQAILDSRTALPTGINHFLAIQLAPNGKIYLARLPTVSISTLSVIDQPNNAGISCDLQLDVVDLEGRWASTNLPNFLDSFDYHNSPIACATDAYSEHVSESNFTLVHPNPISGPWAITLDRPISAGMLLIYDAVGQLLKINSDLDGVTIQFEKPTVPPGIYIIELQENQSTVFRGAIIID